MRRLAASGRWSLAAGAFVLALGTARAARAEGHLYLNGVLIDGARNTTLENVRVTIDAKGDIYLDAKGYAVQVISPGAALPAAAAAAAAAAVATPPAGSPAATATPAAAASQPARPAGSATPDPRGGAAASAAPGATAAAVSTTVASPAQTATATPVAPPQPVVLSKHYWLAALQASHPGATQYDVDVYLNGDWVARVRSSDPSFVPIEVSKHVHPGKNTVHFSALKNLAGGGRISQAPTDTLDVILGEGTVDGGKLTIDTVDADFRRTAADTDPVALDDSFAGR